VKFGDYPKWQGILTDFSNVDETEITKVEIKSVEAAALDGSKFREIHDPPPYIAWANRLMNNGPRPTR